MLFLQFVSLQIEFTYSFLIGEESVKELQRKRHSASPGVSLKGRVRKVARWKAATDSESDEESDGEFVQIRKRADLILAPYPLFLLLLQFSYCLLFWALFIDIVDSEYDSNESDDEFQICEVCNGEEVILMYIFS